MKQVGRKAASILLTLCMLLTMLPVSALAAASQDCSGGDSCMHEAAIGTTHYDTIGEAIDAANGMSGSDTITVTLLKDATMTGGQKNGYYTTKDITRDITLDLGGHTLDYAENGGFLVNPGFHFTVQNGTYINTSTDSWAQAITGSHYNSTSTGATITVASNAVIQAVIGVCADGYTTLNVYGTIDSTKDGVYVAGPKNDVTLDGAKIEAGVYGVYQQGNGGGSSYDIKNSTITTPDTEGSCAVFISNSKESAENSAEGMQTLNIENSVISGQDGIEVRYTNVTISGDRTEVTSAEDGYALGVTHNGSESAVGNLSITGGTFTGDIWVMEGTDDTATLTISGGTFSVEIPEKYCAGGFAPVENADGTWSVKEEEETPPEPTGVAQIGDKTYPTLEKAFGAVESSGTIKLLADTGISNTITISASQSIVLDLNGNTITELGEATRKICNNGTLTIRTSVAGGTLKNTDAGSYGLIDNYGTLTIESGTFENYGRASGAAIKNRPGAKLLKIEGGEFKGLVEDPGGDQNGYATAANVLVASEAPLTITGGDFSSRAHYSAVFKIFADTADISNVTVSTYMAGGIEVAGGNAVLKDCSFHVSEENSYYANAVAVSGGGTATIDGGTYTGYKYAAYVYNSGGTINIEDGTFGAETVLKADNSTTSNKSVINVTKGDFTGNIAIGNQSTLAISGGTFTAEILQAYCAEGFKPEQNTDGTWGVVAETTYVAQIGEKGYTTLKEAIEAAGENATITLLCDITQAETISVGEGKSLTLDLSGYAISVGAAGSGLENYGTLTITDSSAPEESHGIGSGRIYTTDVEAQGRTAVTNYGTLIINGGIFGDKNTDQTDVNDVQRGNALRNYGTATVNGGAFTCCDNYTNGGYAYAIANGSSSYPNAELTINYATAYGSINGLLASDGGKVTVEDGIYTLGDGTETNLWRVVYTSGTGSVEINGGTYTKNTTTNYGFFGDYGGGITVTGGTFEDAHEGNDIYVDAGAVTITGGTFKDELKAATGAAIAVSGGTFSSVIPQEYCAVGYVPVTEPNEDGYYGVVKKNEAEINGKQYATLREALNKVRDGETIKILAPATVNMTETYAITGKAITLDLNGQTVTWNTSAVCAIDVKSGGKLTIQDTSTQKSGALNIISTYATSTANSGIRVNAGGSLNLTGGTVSYYHANKTGYGAIYLNSGSGHQFTMSGGTVKISGYANYGIKMSGGTGMITGGTVEFDDLSYTGTMYGVYVLGASCTISNLEVDASAVAQDKKVTCIYSGGPSSPVNISGGTYSANNNESSFAVGGSLYSGNGTTITDGTFNGTVDAKSITGGKFSEPGPADSLPEGMIFAKQEGEDYYSVVEGTYVALLGTVGYTSWDALWNDASGGTTASAVYILADVNEITVPEGKNVTFYNSGNCTIGKITNNGTCKIISYAMTGTEVVNNGSLNLGHEVKSLVNNQGATMEATSYSYAKVTDSITNSGTMTISKGTYPCAITNTGTITLTGGSFTQEVTDWCKDGYTTQKSGDLWIVVKEGPHVAEIDGYWYTSLSAAINAAKDGETVKLLMDTTLGTKESINNKNITLDLNEKNITYTATGSSESTAGAIIVKGTSHVTITGNGSIDFDNSYLADGAGSTGRMIEAEGTAILTIENGTFHAGLTCVLADGNAQVYIKGGAYSAYMGYDGRMWLLNLQDNENAVFFVSGGTFKNYDPTNSDTESPADNFCTPEYAATPTKDESGNTIYTVVEAEARIGETGYVTLADAIAAAGDNDTITLLADVTEDVVVPAGKNITLDLYGHKITNDSDHTIVNNGTLTITDNSEAKTGTVDNVTHGKGALVNNGTVKLSGGTFERSLEAGTLAGANGNSWYTIVNDGTMIIENGVTVKNKGGFSSMICNSKSGVMGNLTIDGGTFDGGINTVKNDVNSTLTINGGTFTNSAQYVIMNWNKATINGGTFATKDTAYAVLFTSSWQNAPTSVGELVITNGTFTTATEAQKLIVDRYDGSNIGTASISGGTFSVQPDDPYLADGYAPVDNGNGTWGVEMETTYVAEVNSQKYESLIEAVNAAKVNGQTVKLLANVELQPVEGKDYALLIDNGESMTLDLNGHKITATLNNTAEFNLIKNYGKLTITDDSEGQNGSIEVTENGSAEKARTSVIYNGYSSGEFTLEAGTLKLTGSEGSEKPLYGVYSSGTTMVMNGGAIEVRRENASHGGSTSGQHWDVYGIYNGSGCQTTVNGGKITVENQGRYNSAYGIYNANGTVSIHGDPNTPYIEANAFVLNDATWYEHTLTGKITLYGGKYNMQTDTATGWIENENNITIAEGYEKKFNGDRTVSIVKSPVAQIGSTKYDTLADAVAAVKSGETIQLLADVTDGSGIIVPSGSNFTIDFAGHTYTVTNNLAGSTGTKSQCFQLLKGSTVTMQNGTIEANDSGITMIIQNYANLTLDDMTLDATQGKNSVSYVMSNNCGNVTITGDTNITAKEGKVAFDVYYWPSGSYVEGVTVTVDENMTGTITGKVEYGSDDSPAGKENVAENAHLYIEAGTFDGQIVTQHLDTDEKHGISISGGSFSVKPEDGYLAPYYEATQNTTGDNYWTVDVDANVEAIWITDTDTKAGMLSDLLGEATSGTVQLLKNVTTTGYVTVGTNVTLDLAGKTLDTTNSGTFSVFGKVVDSTEGKGLLKLQEGSYTIQQDNPSLPIYDNTAGGYRLYTYQLTTLRTYEPVTANTVQFWFKLTFTNEEAWELLTAGNENHGITVKSKYQFSGQTASESWFSFNSEFIHWIAAQVVSSQYTQDQLGFYLNVTNTNLLGERTMTVTPAVDSVPSVGTESKQMTYSLNLGE